MRHSNDLSPGVGSVNRCRYLSSFRPPATLARLFHGRNALHRSIRLAFVVTLVLGLSGCKTHHGDDVQPLSLPVLPEVHVAGLPDGVGAPRLVVDRTRVTIDTVPMVRAWRRQARIKAPGALDDPRLKLTRRPEPSITLAKLDPQKTLLVKRLERLQHREAAVHEAFSLGSARALDIAIAGDVSSETAIDMFTAARSAKFDRLRLLVHVGKRLVAVPIFTPAVRGGFGGPAPKGPHCGNTRLSVTRAGITIHVERSLAYKCGSNLRMGIPIFEILRKKTGLGSIRHASGAESPGETPSTTSSKTLPTDPAWDGRTIVVDRKTCPTFPFHGARAFEPLLGKLMDRIGHTAGGLCCLTTVEAARKLPFGTFARVLASVRGHAGITDASPALIEKGDETASATCKDAYLLP